jgi:hypothetical protein
MHHGKPILRASLREISQVRNLLRGENRLSPFDDCTGSNGEVIEGEFARGCCVVVTLRAERVGYAQSRDHLAGPRSVPNDVSTANNTIYRFFSECREDGIQSGEIPVNIGEKANPWHHYNFS